MKFLRRFECLLPSVHCPWASCSAPEKLELRERIDDTAAAKRPEVRGSTSRNGMRSTSGLQCSYLLQYVFCRNFCTHPSHCLHQNHITKCTGQKIIIIVHKDFHFKRDFSCFLCHLSQRTPTTSYVHCWLRVLDVGCRELVTSFSSLLLCATFTCHWLCLSL